LISYIFGSLLGDGYAEKHGTRIRFYQESSHKYYLLWLHQIIVLQGYTLNEIPQLQTRLGNYGDQFVLILLLLLILFLIVGLYFMKII